MFDLGQSHELFLLLRAGFEQQRERLDRLDAAIGDGDHGATVERAFQAAAGATAGSFDDLGAMFDAASQALAENTGGAIGPLLAAFFAEGGTAFRGKKAAGSEDVYRFLAGGLEALQEVGGARPGDKTLIDALAPAVAAFAAGRDQPLEQALQAAAAAAAAGAEATGAMLARHGRAHFLGQRSLGHPDPGATSMAMLLDGFHLAAAGQKGRPESQKRAAFTPAPGKLINDPDNMIRQDNEGLALAYPRLVRLDPDGILIRSTPKSEGKVGLAIGHGGGHTPSMGGFVGPGLLDADVYGPLFTCASGIRIARAIAAADRGNGVVLLVSNHSGDVLNARLGVRRARAQGILVEPVLLGDDLATAPRMEFQERRGLGGLLFALKIGGAAAEAGWGLQEIAALMAKVNERTATLAVAVRPPTHPATGAPLFELPPGQIEVGTGVHGEVGVYRGEHMPADALVDLLVERLVKDLQAFPEKQLLVFINGSGGTSRMELHILYRRAHQNLSGRGFNVQAGVVDSFFTTQEMGGFSLSLCAVDDDLAALWQAPASAPSFRWPYL